MNDKHRILLDQLLAEIPEKDKDLYSEITGQAVSMGYLPKRTKTRLYALDFSNSRLSRTIMKLEAPDTAKIGSKPGLRLKFYAAKDYSDIFRQGVQRVIEEFNGRYTGCYGCGRCGAELEGYTYIYPDGRTVFRCGGELIAIKDWESEHLPEIKELLKTQDNYWKNKAEQK
ncbi:MAG: hypothetical protein AB9835_13795 [Eubacteriales bacterium]